MIFARRSPKPVKTEPYLLMDQDSNLIAKGDLIGEVTESNLEIKVPAGTADRVVAANVVQALPVDRSHPVVMGRVIMRRGNNITLEFMRAMGSEVRKNFRMPVNYTCYLYFPGAGRATYRSIDLSCGGIAFTTAAPLTVGERMEIVIPITLEGPLIVLSQVLRVGALPDGSPRYAAKFADITPDEEAALQEAVFNAQMEYIRISKQKKG